eukprot:7878335-Pyramimonas_sp.AAC.1
MPGSGLRGWLLRGRCAGVASWPGRRATRGCRRVPPLAMARLSLAITRRARANCCPLSHRQTAGFAQFSAGRARKRLLGWDP